MNLPRVSIVACCYAIERFRDLSELLDSIEAQRYQNIETWLVSDGNIELFDILKKYVRDKGYQGIQVLYHQGGTGVSGSRNLAIKHVTGEIIAFCDDDAILPPDWVEEIVKTYNEDHSIIGVTGPILPLWEQESMCWFPKELYWIFSCTYSDIVTKQKVRNGYGTNLSFRLEAFELTGLFNESLGVRKYVRGIWNRPAAEETDFSLRVYLKTGKQLVYNPTVKVAHKVYRYRLTMSFITHRAYWEGYAKAMLNYCYPSPHSGEPVLSTEYELLWRILYQLIPKIIRSMAKHPLIAFRQLWITFVVLFCVATGYFSYWFSKLLRKKHVEPIDRSAIS